MRSDIMFSVVIPVYNKAEYLVETVESVLSQTYRNFELILVCDPSTDDSTTIAQSYAGENIRVLVRDEAGAGGYAARNAGISHALGSFIAFLDADDIWYDTYLQKIYSVITSNKNIDAVSTSWVSSRAINKSVTAKRSNSPYSFDLNAYLNSALEKRRLIHTSFFTVRRELLQSNKISFPEMRGATSGGDLFTWLNVMVHAGRCIHIPEVLGVYRQDVMGQVTKNSIPNGALFTKNDYCSLCKKIKSKKDHYLLAKYFNYKNVFYCKKAYVKGHFLEISSRVIIWPIVINGIYSIASVFLFYLARFSRFLRKRIQ